MQLLDALQIKRHRLTVDQYHRMMEVGVIEADARVELIEGSVIEMAPVGNRHHAAVIRLSRLLAKALDGRAVVSTRLSLGLDHMTETRPDLAIYRPRAGLHADGPPTGRDALLVIEISDTKLDYDVRVKGPLYAQHGVSAYWIFDLPARALRCFRAARGDAYTDIIALETPDVVTLPGLDVRVDLAGVL